MTGFSKLIVILLIFNTSLLDASDSSLRLVQIVQRHGDRNPTNFYPNDPYQDPSLWPDGIGELNRLGKARMYEFGRTIRNKYDNYLGDSPREVYCRSSALTRTLESAQTFIAGVYEPKGFWIWSNATQLAQLWQPISVNTVPAEDDGLLRTSAVCPKADQLWTEFMQTKEVTDYLKENEEFIKTLSTHTGDEYWTVRPSPLRPLEFLSTTLRVERENGFSMPEWATQETLDHLRQLELHAFYFDWKSPQIHRLRAGQLLDELTKNMLDRADQITRNSSADYKKLRLYETHDVNQVVLMQALNVYDNDIVNKTPPTYTDSLIFELHEINGQFVVKLLYYNNVSEANTSTDAYVTLKLVDCDPEGDCTLRKFIKSIDNLIPNDWQSECERININSDQEYTYFNAFSVVYIIAGLLIGILSMVVLTGICKYRHRSDETNAISIREAKKYSD